VNATLGDMNRSIEFWVKVAQIVQASLTPLIAIWIGIVTSRIQRQQAKTQQQQAQTTHLQHRLALLDRRMKIFNSTQEFIALVLRDAKVEEIKTLSQCVRDTREHHLLFGTEIGEYLDELYKKASRLHVVYTASVPQGNVLRPEHIPVELEIVDWFSRQPRAADEKFLKYIDFREP
jgi:7-keto-8-aminopelargonate synthetase-like enzyme